MRLSKADAIQSGDGGKAIVWSDEITRVNGTISARGGAASGRWFRETLATKRWTIMQSDVVRPQVKANAVS